MVYFKEISIDIKTYDRLPVGSFTIAISLISAAQVAVVDNTSAKHFNSPVGPTVVSRSGHLQNGHNEASFGNRQIFSP
jgi:hypothetical protein